MEQTRRAAFLGGLAAILAAIAGEAHDPPECEVLKARIFRAKIADGTVGAGLIFGPREARQAITVWDDGDAVRLVLETFGPPATPLDAHGPTASRAEVEFDDSLVLQDGRPIRDWLLEELAR